MLAQLFKAIFSVISKMSRDGFMSVPKAASTEPTAVAPRLRCLPNHSIPLTKYSQAR